MTDVELLRLVSWIAVATALGGLVFNVRIVWRAGPRPLALALLAKGICTLGIALVFAISSQWVRVDTALRTPNVYYTYIARGLLAAMPLSLIFALSRLTRRRDHHGCE